MSELSKYVGTVVGVQKSGNGVNTVSAGPGLSSMAFSGDHGLQKGSKVSLQIDPTGKVTGVEVLEPAGA